MILNCTGAVCTLTQADDIASGAVNTFTADFTFDSDWSGLTKTAVFNNGYQTKAVLLVADSATIPWEVMADPGNLYIGCVGVTDSTTILTTNMLKVGRIVIGADTSVDPSTTPTPDVYDQIISSLAEKVEYTDIVDDLTTGGSAVPLSAEQGKVLDEYIDDLESYAKTPVATYIHSGNPEIVVSAIDVGTDTFTSAGHGLSADDTIYPILNSDAGAIYPIDVYAGGLTQTIFGYYIISDGFTTDTFKISESSGGSALDITVNANLDLTKWHFEKATVNDSFTISNLPAVKRYRIRVQGRILQKNAATAILPNSMSFTSDWLNLGSSIYTFAQPNAHGDLMNTWNSIIDFNDFLVINIQGMRCSSNTSSANTLTLLRDEFVNLNNSNTDIIAIQFYRHNPANGYKVEVYTA